MSKRFLGFDFGMRKIGVAIGQSVTGTARELSQLKAKDGIPDWTQIEKIIQEWEVAGLVVGLPVKIDGQTQHTTYAAQKFANRLKEKFKLPVYLVDERLTTVEARQQVFDQGGLRQLNKADIDSMAAKLILEQWLNENDK